MRVRLWVLNNQQWQHIGIFDDEEFARQDPGTSQHSLLFGASSSWQFLGLLPRSAIFPAMQKGKNLGMKAFVSTQPNAVSFTNPNTVFFFLPIEDF